MGQGLQASTTWHQVSLAASQPDVDLLPGAGCPRGTLHTAGLPLGLHHPAHLGLGRCGSAGASCGSAGAGCGSAGAGCGCQQHGEGGQRRRRRQRQQQQQRRRQRRQRQWSRGGPAAEGNLPLLPPPHYVKKTVGVEVGFPHKCSGCSATASRGSPISPSQQWVRGGGWCSLTEGWWASAVWGCTDGGSSSSCCPGAPAWSGWWRPGAASRWVLGARSAG